MTEVGLAGRGVHTADVLSDDDLPQPGAPGETLACRGFVEPKREGVEGLALQQGRGIHVCVASDKHARVCVFCTGDTDYGMHACTEMHVYTVCRGI